ncbi:MAG: hypothetical protein QG656_2539 [Candidatus Hydrogenedentes bacterium]|nr:hypothetical protein [Candidatus Hydrogenedentota bacterium]
MNALMAIALLCAAAAEPSVSVEASLDPPVVPFHRDANYTIAVTVNGEADVTMPDMVGRFGGLEVHDVQRNTEAVEGGKRITETYILTPVFAGTYPIAPAEIKLGDGSSVVAPAMALRVRALTEEELAAAQEFAPNAPPESLPTPLWQTWPFWAAVACTIALLAGATVLLIRRRERIERAAPPAPAWEVAYARLRELDQRQLPKTGKFEAYYVDLSAILRYYIEDRFRLHAPEQTTPEFLDTSSRSGAFNEIHQKLLASFLRHCDRVKFARYEPAVEEMDNSFAVVLQFVDETVPKAEEAASAPKEDAA